jgi:hypothetical protein
MRPSFKALSTRAATRARETAAGSPVPAGQEPPPPNAAELPTAGGRAALRRRARRVGHLREALVRDLGALVVEMERLGRRNDELVARKAKEVEALDRELRELTNAIGGHRTIGEVVAAGVAGSCDGCGTLLGIDDRFCSRCGLPAGATAAAPPPPPPPPPAPAAPDELEATGAERR